MLPTKGLGRFLQVMALRPTPVLIDLGAVVGSNVTFLGDRLGCKLLVEDVFADLERFSREGRIADLPAFIAQRFTQADGSVDGVLCWDVFDYLDKASARALGGQIGRILRPGGAALAFFGTVREEGEAHFTRYVMRDDKTLAHRPYAATRAQQPVLTNRDVALLFPALKVSDSFLLLSKKREVLFRK